MDDIEPNLEDLTAGPSEQESNLQLDEPCLNDLESETENNDHVSEPKPSPEQCQPVESKEFVLFEMGDFKLQLGSCFYDSVTLSNQALAIYFKVKEEKTNEPKTQSYLG